MKYLKIDKEDVLKIWEHVLSGIKYHINKIANEEVSFNSDFDTITFLLMVLCH